MHTAHVAALTAAAEPGAARASDAVALLLPLALALAVVLVVLHLRRRHGTGGYRSVPHRWDGRATAPPSEAEARRREPSVAELDARARGLLIRLDDAVLQRDEELRAAAAQSGTTATDPHRAAVADAAAQAEEALRMRHRLDDPAVRRNETEHRRVLNDIIGRCSRARDRLNVLTGSLAQARGLPDGAGEALASARSRGEALAGRLDAAEDMLRRLDERYAERALTPVRGHPVAARERLAAARDELARADRAVAAGDLTAAADAVRAAEAGIGQGEALAEGVTRWARELGRADNALAQALTATGTDVAEAPGLPALRDAVDRARQALTEAREGAGPGPRDPFGGLRRLAEGATPLAQALAPDREREARNRRDRMLLEEALLTAGAELTAARDYITTHRGEVGSPARARLAEAGHQLDRALGTAPHDAAAALPFAWRADALAREARALALRDANAVA
ncbi:TPM domain-containing protein [Streptomyces litchfieldiae]|uniref:TPM domain-containing protein n=1 Tax=Streptomyces litchfieldiae TaxID=3075543 RepID=A0ABU2MLY4_9ACTN|nr:TPM domain-containing protein [Streptomyces sp. DSM 44938]MDT0342481.1 TPM domain-containing protein [Streptomyces sp. DSM 44938]